MDGKDTEWKSETEQQKKIEGERGRGNLREGRWREKRDKDRRNGKRQNTSSFYWSPRPQNFPEASSPSYETYFCTFPSLIPPPSQGLTRDPPVIDKERRRRKRHSDECAGVSILTVYKIALFWKMFPGSGEGDCRPPSQTSTCRELERERGINVVILIRSKTCGYVGRNWVRGQRGH